MLTTRTRIKVLSELAEEKGAVELPVKVTKIEYENPEEIETRRERRRKKIISELFETEKTYLHHLEMAQKFFEFPLRFNCILMEKDHSMLFSNLEQILEVNKKLLEHMEQMTIGTAFKFLGPFLKLYSMYANNHSQASTVLQTNMQKNGNFTKFVREQEARPELMGLKLGALLITPVQRIPRYKLLLEDVLENTCPDHHDYQHLKEAAKQVGEIAMHINEHVRKHENFQKMFSIQHSFDSSAPKILEPGREFIKEGSLRKVARRGGKAQERMFFLFSDMVLYGKPRLLLDGGGNSYSCCCVLPLRHCQVEKVLGSLQTSDGGGMFRLNCKDESLLLCCRDTEEARSWIETLETAIRKLNNNRQTLRKPSSNKLPVRGKSIVKLRLKEKKQDLKRRLGRGRKKSTQSKRSLSPMKALSSMDITNCLSPSKRSRTDSPADPGTATHSKVYEKKNEISLDNWSPAAQRLSYVDDEDENTPRSSGSLCNAGPQWMSYIDEEDESRASTAVSATAGFNYTENLQYENDQGWTNESNDRDPAIPVANSNRLSSTSSNSDIPPKSEPEKYSSQPWINPNFTRTEESSNCTSGPFRKVTQMTSSIGGMMDNVRSGKRCSLM